MFDCIAANILSSALLAGKNKLLSMLKPGGTLILAGIQDAEFEIVKFELTAKIAPPKVFEVELKKMQFEITIFELHA